MLEARAVVVHVDKQSTQVRASGGGGCSACNGKGCGSGKLTRLFGKKSRQFEVDNRINAAIGDEVIVSVPDGSVLRGIGLVYLLPLLLMFGGATLAGGYAVNAAQRDGYSAAGALLGLVAGFILARWLSARQDRRQPYIARLFRE